MLKRSNARKTPTHSSAARHDAFGQRLGVGAFKMRQYGAVRVVQDQCASEGERERDEIGDREEYFLLSAFAGKHRKSTHALEDACFTADGDA